MSKYDKVHPSEIKFIPVDSCVRYYCKKTGEIGEGTFCSYFYDADSINLNISDKNIQGGRTVFVKKKKGEFSKESADIELLKDELHLIREEHKQMKDNISNLTKAIKILMNKSNQH